MNHFDNEIRFLQNEIANLKIFKAKQASTLKTDKQFFSIEFKLSWDDDFNQPTSEYVYLDARTNGNNVPMASVAIEESDLQNREIASYCSSQPGVYENAKCRLFFRVYSNNAEDISATQGGGTKNITLNFSITGTAKFEIVPD